ncbi:NmrA family NAD(P)-binding protein [Actinacidiphila oryziradicis]|uniref:NAD-dependent epimerase/dehydratase family protein n=1 Tax=Actinacidiphila oryziradicis TaxID=2571141 RepID=A0A4U0SIE9_9ACTN|nr:NAD(P)H-binding protein [Actinacidiphila oryziradicis]TKA09500.1 NAD-dependent epimerase/dehydratase family protein [Actinacidiphila oryziradicis]
MIVITAPTGQIGHQTLAKLLDSGQPIRVIARDPARLSPQVRERVEIVQGSHSDSDVVTEAFAGADSVLWLVPPNPRADDIEDYYLDFTRPACDAINSQGVKRVIGVSSLGRAYGKPAGLLSPAFAMDELIESTGVNYRSLAMPFFMENLLSQVEAIKSQGIFFLANSTDRPLATVATRDIAAAAADLLLDDSWSGQGSVPVISPNALSPNDMAKVLSEVLERPVRFQQISNEAYKTTMLQYGMTDGFTQGLVDMATAQNDGIYDAEQRTLQTAGPTSFRQWCQDVLKPALTA